MARGKNKLPSSKELLSLLIQFQWGKSSVTPNSDTCANHTSLKGRRIYFHWFFVAFCWKRGCKSRNRCQTRPIHSYGISVAGKNGARALRIFNGSRPSLEMKKGWGARTKSSWRWLVSSLYLLWSNVYIIIIIIIIIIIVIIFVVVIDRDDGYFYVYPSSDHSHYK